MKVRTKGSLFLAAVIILGILLVGSEPVVMVFATEQSSVTLPIAELSQQYFPLALLGVIALVIISVILSIFLYYKYYKRYFEKISKKENKGLTLTEGKQQVRTKNS